MTVEDRRLAELGVIEGSVDMDIYNVLLSSPLMEVVSVEREIRVRINC